MGIPFPMLLPTMRSTNWSQALSIGAVALTLGVGWASITAAEPARFLETDRRFDVIPSPPWPGGPGEALQARYLRRAEAEAQRLGGPVEAGEIARVSPPAEPA